MLECLHGAARPVFGQIQPGAEAWAVAEYDDRSGRCLGKPDSVGERGKQRVPDRVALARPVQSDPGDVIADLVRDRAFDIALSIIVHLLPLFHRIRLALFIYRS